MANKGISPVKGVILMMSVMLVLFLLFGTLPFGLQNEFVVSEEDISFKNCKNNSIKIIFSIDPYNYQNITVYNNGKYVKNIEEKGMYIINTSKDYGEIKINSTGEEYFSKNFKYDC